MTNTKRLILIAGGFALLILVAVLAYHTLSYQAAPENGAAGQSAASRQKAPDFTVVDRENKAVSLSALRGKPVILNFWATWCPYCKDEMPLFDQLYKEEGNNILFMMIDLTDGQNETVSQGQAYITSKGFSFPVYFDTKQEAIDAYGLNAIPQTYFIDKDGYIVKNISGAATEQELRQGIALLKEAE